MSEKTYGGQEMVMIDSARRLFIEKGFEDTTMCDIAELAGVNRSTLHYYFPNKDVMFKAVFSSIVETLMPRLREIMSSNKPLIERLALVVDEYFERFLENPSIPGFIISEIQRDVLNSEMKAGRLKQVPMYTVFTAFYGNIAFPFITKNLFVSWFNMDENEYRAMIMEWKKYLLMQISNLLVEE